MKRFLVLMLMIGLVLSALPAGAESGAYIPGEITLHLFRQALERGNHISADVSGVFMPGEGFTSDPELNEILTAISDLLGVSALRLGFARTGEGLRFELGGYCLGDEDTVYTDNALVMNREGLILESDMLGDRRLSVLWETVLEYLGIEEDTIRSFLSLREFDFSSFTRKQLPVLLNRLEAEAAPYAEIILSWADELPVDTVDHLEDNDLVPGMPGMKQIVIRRNDFLRLAEALLGYTQEKDVSPVLTDALSALRTEISNLLSEEGDGGCVTLTYGRGDPLPLIIEADFVREDGDALCDFTFALVPGESENHADLLFRLSATTDEGTFTLDADGYLLINAENPLASGFSISASADLDGEEIFAQEQTQNVVSFTAESGQPGYRTEQSAQTIVQTPGSEEDDAVITRASTESTAEWVRTEDGGESYTMHAVSDYDAGGEETSAIVDTAFAIEPVEDAVFDATFYETLSIPDSGVESIGFVTLITAEQYIPYGESLETVRWEDLSGEERDELKREFLTSARMQRDQFLFVLPDALRGIASVYIGGSSGQESSAPTRQEYLDGFMEGYGSGYDDGFRAGYEAATGMPFPSDGPGHPEGTESGNPDTDDLSADVRSEGWLSDSHFLDSLMTGRFPEGWLND